MCIVRSPLKYSKLADDIKLITSMEHNSNININKSLNIVNKLNNNNNCSNHNRGIALQNYLFLENLKTACESATAHVHTGSRVISHNNNNNVDNVHKDVTASALSTTCPSTTTTPSVLPATTSMPQRNDCHGTSLPQTGFPTTLTSSKPADATLATHSQHYHQQQQLSSSTSATDLHLRGLVDGLTRFFTPSNKRSSRVSRNAIQQQQQQQHSQQPPLPSMNSSTTAAFKTSTKRRRQNNCSLEKSISEIKMNMLSDKLTAIKNEPDDELYNSLLSTSVATTLSCQSPSSTTSSSALSLSPLSPLSPSSSTFFLSSSSVVPSITTLASYSSLSASSSTSTMMLVSLPSSPSIMTAATAGTASFVTTSTNGTTTTTATTSAQDLNYPSLNFIISSSLPTQTTATKTKSSTRRISSSSLTTSGTTTTHTRKPQREQLIDGLSHFFTAQGKRRSRNYGSSNCGLHSNYNLYKDYVYNSSDETTCTSRSRSNSSNRSADTALRVRTSVANNCSSLRKRMLQSPCSDHEVGSVAPTLSTITEISPIKLQQPSSSSSAHLPHLMNSVLLLNSLKRSLSSAVPSSLPLSLVTSIKPVTSPSSSFSFPPSLSPSLVYSSTDKANNAPTNSKLCGNNPALLSSSPSLLPSNTSFTASSSSSSSSVLRVPQAISRLRSTRWMSNTRKRPPTLQLSISDSEKEEGNDGCNSTKSKNYNHSKVIKKTANHFICNERVNVNRTLDCNNNISNSCKNIINSNSLISVVSTNNNSDDGSSTSRSKDETHILLSSSSSSSTTTSQCHRNRKLQQHSTASHEKRNKPSPCVVTSKILQLTPG
ncbi:hypothetical protein HELRODRAFT_175686 [Helobdella robusta]|uniref:Uncharacterized protein n=1 Tax=Helobdella robusta TaxID=6412 RepID=T1F9J0_HELRO|nr:hypothetical protein HELRODRAFT_175686 [Helobdella robusta]ESO00699.1 hypothetical protein HELRODRAFT_175686 [Helobdella robusta]